MSEKLGTLKETGGLLLATLLFLVPALYNQFPLVYSDTGTYLLSGFENWLPNDRPIFYGWFIRVASLNYWSIWLVVVLQSWLLSYAINLLLSHFFKKPLYLTILIALPLSILTGAGWYASQLMPDVFIAIGSISLCNLLLAADWKNSRSIISIGLVVLSSLSHLSHILVFVVFGLFCLLLFKHTSLAKRLSLLALPLVAALALAFTNYTYLGTFQLSNGSSIFLTGKLIDSGLLKPFLDRNCDDSHYVLCSYKEDLPSDSRSFLWNGDSPLAKTGGWENSNKAYQKMLWDFFTDWKDIAGFTLDFFKSGTIQLTQNSIGSGLISDWYASESSPPYAGISKAFPNQINPYLQSRQNTNLWNQGLSFTSLNFINYTLIVLSVTWLLYLWLFNSSPLNTNQKVLLKSILALVLINALVTGGLANVYDRLQARISWLLILLGFILYAPSIKKLLSQQ